MRFEEAAIGKFSLFANYFFTKISFLFLFFVVQSVQIGIFES